MLSWKWSALRGQEKAVREAGAWRPGRIWEGMRRGSARPCCKGSFKSYSTSEFIPGSRLCLPWGLSCSELSLLVLRGSRKLCAYVTLALSLFSWGRLRAVLVVPASQQLEQDKIASAHHTGRACLSLLRNDTWPRPQLRWSDPSLSSGSELLSTTQVTGGLPLYQAPCFWGISEK